MTRSVLAPFILLALTTTASACAGWQPSVEVADDAPAAGGRSERFDEVLARARAGGWVEDVIDRDAGYIRFRAKYGDGGAEGGAVTGVSPGAVGYVWTESTQSWLIVQVEPDGALTVRATGASVRASKGQVHRKLNEELRGFARTIGAEVRAS